MNDMARPTAVNLILAELMEDSLASDVELIYDSEPVYANNVRALSAYIRTLPADDERCIALYRRWCFDWSGQPLGAFMPGRLVRLALEQVHQADEPRQLASLVGMAIEDDLELMRLSGSGPRWMEDL